MTSGSGLPVLLIAIWKILVSQNKTSLAAVFGFTDFSSGSVPCYLFHIIHLLICYPAIKIWDSRICLFTDIDVYLIK